MQRPRLRGRPREAAEERGHAREADDGEGQSTEDGAHLAAGPHHPHAVHHLRVRQPRGVAREQRDPVPARDEPGGHLVRVDLGATGPRVAKVAPVQPQHVGQGGQDTGRSGRATAPGGAGPGRDIGCRREAVLTGQVPGPVEYEGFDVHAPGEVAGNRCQRSTSTPGPADPPRTGPRRGVLRRGHPPLPAGTACWRTPRPRGARPHRGCRRPAWGT